MINEGWQAVAAIIGVATVIGSTWVSIYKHNHPKEPKSEKEGTLEVRVIKLEGDMAHVVRAQEQMKKDHDERRQRFETVVDSIFAHIHEMRKEFMALLKELRK